MTAREPQSAHVADVEEPAGGPHLTVLLENRREEKGHLPAGEVDHAAALLDVVGVEGRLEKRRGVVGHPGTVPRRPAARRAGGRIRVTGTTGATEASQPAIRVRAPET